VSSHLCRASEKDRIDERVGSRIIHALMRAHHDDDLFFLAKLDVSMRAPRSLHCEPNCRFVFVDAK
jgi:hypothetical protein